MNLYGENKGARMKKVAIFGTEGMLGNAVLKVFNDSKFQVKAINRAMMDAQTASTEEIKYVAGDCEYIINCIGIIKPYIHDDNAFEVERAIAINSIFPHNLAKTGIKIIQIATDCVYDGIKGNYVETDKHNALDVYGKTKSLGEVSAPNFLNLRNSIIGPENINKLSLLEWFLTRPQSEHVNGYKNHLWNGITTFAFAKICIGIIEKEIFFGGLQHIVPANILSKCDMLHVFADVFSRKDISITGIEAEEAIDRTVATINAERNKLLWASAGYTNIPTIEEMIREIKNYQ